MHLSTEHAPLYQTGAWETLFCIMCRWQNKTAFHFVMSCSAFRTQRAKLRQDVTRSTSLRQTSSPTRAVLGHCLNTSTRQLTWTILQCLCFCFYIFHLPKISSQKIEPSNLSMETMVNAPSVQLPIFLEVMPCSLPCIFNWSFSSAGLHPLWISLKKGQWWIGETLTCEKPGDKGELFEVATVIFPPFRVDSEIFYYTHKCMLGCTIGIHKEHIAGYPFWHLNNDPLLKLVLLSFHKFSPL